MKTASRVHCYIAL